MQQREFVVMIYRALKFYADDPQTGIGQRRGLLLAASALQQYYGLGAAPALPPEQARRYGERKARRDVPTEQEAKQDNEILDSAHVFV